MSKVIITCESNSIWVSGNDTIRCDYGFETIDYNVFVNNISQSIIDANNIPTLANIFTMPIATDMQTAFSLGFGLPVIAYLVSWGYQTVINFISKDDHIT